MNKIQLRALFFLILLAGQNIVAVAEKTKGGEEFEFQAEVGRLMDILINSLYTNKEVFLRELISNASDALDKLRYMAVQDPSILKDHPELEILIEFNKEKQTLSITDTGIGMNKNDLIQNLGTIAKSGTTNFMEAIKSGNVNIIGQFGVGFYASFLVGQVVTVTSKSLNDDQYIWESSAANSFTIAKDPEGNTLKRGTKVQLQLKQDAVEFLDEKMLTDLIKKYSEFINFPIRLKIFKEVSKEVEDEEAQQEEQKDGEQKKEEQQEEKKKKMKTVKETVEEWKQVNDNKAIWTREKSEIKEDEYKKFYKAMTRDYDDPLSWIHFKAEGEVEFTSLLFIPKKAAHDQFENYYGPSSSLKLYVRRVLINEEFEDLMPKYLSFIKGVVDSDELPINVSRETISQLKMLKVISRKLVKKALEMIRKMAEFDDDEDEEDEVEEENEEKEKQENENTKKEETKEEENEEKEDAEDQEAEEKRKQEKKDRYKEFWKEFGKSIKLGIIEDSNNRRKLAQLSRWYSSYNLNELTSFDQYLERAKPGQDNIYFVAGESKEQLMTNPTLQKLLKKGYEVLLLDDPIDEFTFQHLTEYEKKKLTNVAKGDFKFPDDDDIERQRFKKLKKMFTPLTTWWKGILKDDLEDVKLSQRLVNDPCVIVSTEHGYSANMQRISKAQAYSNTDRAANPYINSKNILEINPSHPAIKELLERVKDEPNTETKDLAVLLYEGAMINSGYQIKDLQGFSDKFYKLFNGALGIEKDAKVEDIEIDLTEDDEEETKKENDGKEFDEQGDLDAENNNAQQNQESPRDRAEDL